MKIQAHILLISLILTTSKVFAASISMSGSLPRSTAATSVSATISIQAVAESHKNIVSDSEKQLSDRIKVYLNSDRNNAFPTGPSDESSTAAFYITHDSQTTQASATAGYIDIIYYFTISEREVGALADEVSSNSNKLNLFISYEHPSDGTNIDNAVYLERLIAVANEAPELESVTGGYKKITVKITSKDEIAYKTDDDTATLKKAPSSVTYYVIKPDSALNLKARVFTPDEEEDPETSCTYDQTAADGANCISCPANTYLSYVDYSDTYPDGVIVQNFSSTNVSISGLENNQNYHVFAVYEPNGIITTSCQLVSPVRDYTWLEVSGEDDATLSDSNCFIATAAYGDNQHEHLHHLRWFRDRHILRYSIGKWFVRQYYEYGPFAANFIKDKPFLRSVVRSILWLPIKAIESVRETEEK